MQTDDQLLMFMETERDARAPRPRIPARLEAALAGLIGDEWWGRWIRCEIPWADEQTGNACRVVCAWMFELYGATVAIGVSGSVMEAHVSYDEIVSPRCHRHVGNLLDVCRWIAAIGFRDPSRYELGNRRLEDCLHSANAVRCSEDELRCVIL